MKKPIILSPPVQQVAAALRQPPDAFQLQPIAGDAGSRFYYRVQCAEASYVAVADSDAEQQRNFIARRAGFAAASARVPMILAEAEGFLLLEDFGDNTYYDILPAPPEQEDTLYQRALDVLINIQCARDFAATLPPYDDALLFAEMGLFTDWYCREQLARPLTGAAARAVRDAEQFLVAEMQASEQVAVHRDYHSRNLMVCAAGSTPGVLDFQDAVRGTALYDVVSLLRDAYVEHTPAWQEKWLRYYWQAARVAGAGAGVNLPSDFTDCQRLYNIAGAQRGLKVLGIFCRLARRDNKPRYLADLPLVHRHLIAACSAVSELAVLGEVVAAHPPPVV